MSIKQERQYVSKKTRGENKMKKFIETLTEKIEKFYGEYVPFI
jgi:hypothetical protein